MAYNEFAYFYDELNGEADYTALFQYILSRLENHGIRQGVVADLGCGTGDLTLMLTQAGYDMIGIDQSEEMLSVVRDKADELGVSGQLLLLQQDILGLDFYGTIRAAISTFDTYNHIPPQSFEQAIGRAAFFMEKGGLFLFDLNTPYKHEVVLGNNTFELETPDAKCVWKNQYDAQQKNVKIMLDIEDRQEKEHFRESFFEYTYEPEYVRRVLEENGFALEEVQDGETFGPLREDSQRMIFTAVKRYTQTEKSNE